MFNSDFDPYDALMTMNDRLHALEKAHNNLARAYEITDRDHKLLAQKYKNLEISHIALADAFFRKELENLPK
jgi:hypothetical protein